MPEIRLLSPSIVNKIAAGEVIERPASIVKELLENSLDAGATRIDVTIQQGGLDLVRITDNGCGISPEQIELAVTAHATSKITSAEDLYRVSTLGFRGEALASIAEVSRLTLRSRPIDADAGIQLEVVGGRRSELAPCGCPIGTTVEVAQLFFNTPVRRKFLRGTQTELGHASEALTRVALAHPQVHFTLRHNERMLYELPAVSDWSQRIAALFGQDLAEDLIWVDSQNGPIHLSGYTARPNQTRGHARMQYLFLNGRPIRDRSLQHALGEAYRGLVLTGRYPIAFLRLDMPAEQVDVNVHPTKLEVRFQDSGQLYSQLLGTLRMKFLTTDLTTKLQPSAGDQNSPVVATTSANADASQSELARWAQQQLAVLSAQRASSQVSEQPETGPLGDFSKRPLELNPLGRAWHAVGEPEEPDPWDKAAALGGGTASDSVPSDPLMPLRPPAAIQVHDRYLVVETHEGIVVIDQHALHERILYEQFREKVLAGELESQRLLVPEPVDLSPAEAAAALAHREVLAQLGVNVEAFGGDTVLLSSYPAMLSRSAPTEVLHELITHLISGGKTPDRRAMIDELLHMMACKAAIKAGDRLNSEEINALVEQRHLAQDTHHCPHGRPTALVFTREELDRQFLRT